jgi:phosphoenolpyruvate carboxykinase (ATP)
MWNWWNGVISGEIPLQVNSTESYLIEKSLLKRLGHLSADGALVVQSGESTSPDVQDIFIVRDDATENIIDWKEGILSLSENKFNDIKTDFLRHIHLLKPELFVMERSAGSDTSFSLGVNLLTTSPVHSLFCKIIMRDRNNNNPLGDYTIYHDPEFNCDNKKYGLRSRRIIALNFKKREILIFGRGQCGEIKKAIFIVMNTILPDYGVLPMQSATNIDPRGNVSVFFGQAGSGKTSLSIDTGMSLIGDDEHGLSNRGVFNLEGGCYANAFDLKESLEPKIFRGLNRFGSLLENVALAKDTREPIFKDKSSSDLGRVAFSLTAFESMIKDGKGKMPNNFFYLSTDVMGVLPLIGELNHDEAVYYFLLGYSAKFSGTEMGMKKVSFDFSNCFGSPYQMRSATVYAELLRQVIKKYAIRVWMVNTGWFGGPPGVGKRYDLSVPRTCIRSIQSGGAHQVTFIKDPVFSISVPTSLEGVDRRFLRPESLWENLEDYFENARTLKKIFDERVDNILKGNQNAFHNQKNTSMHRSKFSI